MINGFIKKIFYYLLLFIVLTTSAFSDESDSRIKKETTEAEDAINDFKDTKFIQIDKLDIPEDIKRIEEQIRQNAIDVIVNTKTHTLIYAQKREKGYSETYKKFHGLEIQITKIPNDQDFFSLHFFYYNWTSLKFDKHLRKRISKFNVLNELRFGMYELLLGKEYIEEHRDEIEKQNYDRIQAVRESENSQARIARKKKKKEEDNLKLHIEKKVLEKLKRGKKDKDEKNVTNSSTDLDQVSSLKKIVFKKNDFVEDQSTKDPDEAEKLEAKNDVGDKKAKKNIRKADSPNTAQENSIENVVSSPVLPKSNEGDGVASLSSLYAFSNIYNETIESDGLIHATTRLRYLGLGARFIQEKDTKMPSGMRFTLKVGMPIKKDNFSFPVYRSFETEIYKRNIFSHFQILAGLDLAPLYFINLPEIGAGIKVFENDIYWFKGGVGYNQELFGREFDFRALFYKSLSIKSNQKKSIAGNAMSLGTYYQQTKKHGYEFLYRQSYFVGDLTVDSKSLYASYIYKFEN